MYKNVEIIMSRLKISNRHQDGTFQIICFRFWFPVYMHLHVSTLYVIIFKYNYVTFMIQYYLLQNSLNLIAPLLKTHIFIGFISF
jgi:hypothetical protein